MVVYALTMRRLCSLLLAIALAPSVSAQTPGRPVQADPVVKLLADLEAALRSGRTADIDALTTDALPDAALDRLDQVWAAGTPTTVTVRERARGPAGAGYEVMADVLVRHGRHGRLVTWQIDTRPRHGAVDRFEISNVRELAAIDGLLRLTLDATKQFAVRDLVFHAPDLELRMSSGTAFVAESDHGVTGLVLLGRGDVHFTPPQPAEQAQLRIYAGQSDYRTTVDTAFIRIHPVEFLLRMKGDSLQPVDVDPDSLRRAEAVFAELSTRTYNLDLRDLTNEAWSLEPSPGSIVVEFRSGRRNWLTYSRSPGENEDISFFERARTRNISVYASGEKLATRGRYYSEDDNAAYDVERYDIDLAFDPARSFISGRGSLRVRATREMSALSLKLAEPLVISSVTAANYGPLLTLRVIGQNTVLVSFPQGLRRDTTVVLDVFYSGRLLPQLLDREAITVDAQSGVQEQERQVMAPEARYLYSNRSAWYPQSERSDYATAAMRLTVPSEFQIVASGSLLSSRLQPVEPSRGGARNRLVVEYAADRPVRYLGLVISRFGPVSQMRVAVPAVAPAVDTPATTSASPPGSPVAGPGINVEIVATARAAGRGRQTSERVSSMLRFMASTFGEAPYPNFTVANVDDNVPGGHSPPFFAMLLHPLPTSTLSWADDPVAMEHIFSNLFLAHEVAHQWWGQAVGWKNYHEQWLSEGLAQYSAVLYAESERGPDVLSRLIVDMRKSAEELSSQGPIYLGYRLGHLQSDGRVFRAIVYNKAAVVLHMLRRLVGDEVFFASLRDFYSARRFRKAGTDDFRTVFEARSSRSLERFFERWIHNAELPQLRISSPTLDSAGRVAKVRVQQLGEVFDIPLPVLVQYQDGKSEEIQVIVNEADREYEIALKSPARRIVVREELLMMSR